ncbi:helix-turn-helix transcriptional regulator [Heyndrickxia sporothermodurans]|uniref:helix-turn-helix domain-containing protein n=1 Tax=Heyndrickxia sporothermodurans TaxID=46224 RepID=UPI002E1DEBBA|nr:helix-turn-helix transcriptional regulator [Heyndrickxia sporothermodurans]MED3697978.1 helix-turn-helix transcriptional regulator [Heyndrickxia sporothermodurans]
MSNIGKAITYFREKAGMTGIALAEKTNLSQSAISQYENGKKNPSEESLIKIAAALSIPVSMLLERAELYSIEEVRNKRVIYEDVDYKIHRERERIYRSHDLVIELTPTLLISMQNRIHDLSYSAYENGRRPKSIRYIHENHISPIKAVISKVMEDFIFDHKDEITYRIEDEIRRLNFDVEKAVDNFRNNWYRSDR